jgi:branched-chain amino acid transport system permease protein
MVSQLLLNALIAGSLYALVGVGFALIFRVVHFFHFTHGLSFTVAAYALFALRQWMALPFPAAVALAAALTIALSLAFEASIFRPLRMRGDSSNLTSLIASIGLYIVGQNLVSIVFGDAALTLREDAVRPGLEFWGARITPIQVTMLITSTISVIAVSAWLRATSSGKNVRAVSGDRELASVVGIATERVTALAVALGTGLGALAGFLAALDRDLVPTMGMNALLMGIVATVVGGADSLVGVVLAAVFVGLAQNLSILIIPAAWQDAIVFGILVAFLLLRPEGFGGRPQRSWAV